MFLRSKPTRVGEGVYVGAVWTNGEPILIADAVDAEAWRGSERFDDVLAAQVDGVGRTLDLELDEGTVDVFRLDDGRVLMIGVVFGSGDNWPAFVGSALEAERKRVGALDVRSGRIAILSSAADWDDVRKVAAEPRAAPKRRRPAEDALLVQCTPGRHDLRHAFVDHAEFGLQVWLLSPPETSLRDSP